MLKKMFWFTYASYDKIVKKPKVEILGRDRYRGPKRERQFMSYNRKKLIIKNNDPIIYVILLQFIFFL